MSVDEVTIIDRLGRDMGRMSVENAHRKGLWHKAVYIYASDGRHVLQRRILEDPCARGTSRSVWDMSFLVGDVLAGETPEMAVKRIAGVARLRLHGLQKLEAPTLTELQLRDTRGRSYCHRTVDYHFAVPCSSLPAIDDSGIRLYPIKDLLDDTCHSLRHTASFGHVHRGPQNREIYDKILRILLAQAR